MLNGIEITKDFGVAACLVDIVIREVLMHLNQLPCLVDAVDVEEHKAGFTWWKCVPNKEYYSLSIEAVKGLLSPSGFKLIRVKVSVLLSPSTVSNFSTLKLCWHNIEIISFESWIWHEFWRKLLGKNDDHQLRADTNWWLINDEIFNRLKACFNLCQRGSQHCTGFHF